MNRSLLRRRDFYASLLVFAIGVAVAVMSATYPVGTLFDMGPGYFPLMIGCLMALIGAMLLVAAILDPREGTATAASHLPDLRGGACIVLAILAFVGFSRLGFVPAALACVFIAAMGDRTMRIVPALILSVVVTGIGVGFFTYGLQLQLPLFGG